MADDVKQPTGPEWEPEPWEDALERARRVATDLEGQVWSLTERMKLAHQILGAIICDCDPAAAPLVFDADACAPCKARAVLDTTWTSNPAAQDRLLDAVLAETPAVSRG